MSGTDDETRSDLDDSDELLMAGLRHAVPVRRGSSERPTPHPSSRTDSEAPPGEGPHPGQVIGDGRYRLTTEIGRGGMGVVYHAEDLQLHRPVAIKLLREGMGASSGPAQRFREEVEIGAQLQHPGIVPVHDAGATRQGAPYLVMKLVTGETLKSRLAARTPEDRSREEFLRTFLHICQAVAYAHARQVVHRDLKPSNIMLGAFGEVYVMDWGLAKVVGAPSPGDPHDSSGVYTRRAHDDPWNSLHGTVVGTPSYMAPEQARGEVARVGLQADVFALGGILLELLTGEPPYPAMDRESAQRDAAAGKIEPALERLRSQVSEADLRSLVESCLALDPAQRPPSATEVAMVVADHLAGVARRLEAALVQSAEERTRAEHERRLRRRTILLLTSLLVAVCLGASVWLWAERRLSEKRSEATSALRGSITRAIELKTAPVSVPSERIERLTEAEAIVRTAIPVARAAGAEPRTLDEATHLADGLREAATVARREASERARQDAFVAQLDELQTQFFMHLDASSTQRTILAAFKEYGLNLEALAVNDAAARIRSSPIAENLRRALDLSLNGLRTVRMGLREEGRRILDILLASDGESLRSEVRRAAHTDDREKLMVLKDDPRLAQLGPGPRGMLGQALGRIEGIAATREHFLELVKDHPDDMLSHVVLANIEAKNPTYGPVRAVGWMRAALARSPNSPSLRSQLAEFLWEAGSRSEAAAEGERLIVDYPGESIAWTTYAATRDLGRRDEILRALNRALEIDSDSKQARRQLAIYHDRNGDYEAALEQLTALMDPDNPDEDDWCDRGGLLGRLQRFEEAEAAYRRAIDMVPSAVRARVCLAGLLSERNRPAEALEHLTKVLREFPSHIQARHILSQQYVRTRQWALAFEQYEIGLRYEPSNPQLLFDRSQVLRHWGRFEESRADLRRILENPAWGKTQTADVPASLRVIEEDIALQRRIADVILRREVIEREQDYRDLAIASTAFGRPELELAIWEQAFFERPDWELVYGARACLLGIRMWIYESERFESCSEAGRARYLEGARRRLDRMVLATADENERIATRVSQDLRPFLEIPETKSLFDGTAPGLSDAQRLEWQGTRQRLEAALR